MYSEYVASTESNGVREDHAAFGNRWLKEHGYEDWEVVIATDDILQLDFDGWLFGTPLPEQFHRVLGIIDESFSPQTVSYKTYASKGGNTHVVIQLPHCIPIMDRVAWQAAFGSDPVREALHIKSIRRKDDNPILLFMHKRRDQKLLAETSVVEG